MTGNNSARNWTIGGVAGLAAVLALLFGVPGNLLNALQLLDRLTGRDTPTTSSTPSTPTGTATPSPLTTPSLIPPDVSDPFPVPTQTYESPSVTQPPPPTSEAPQSIPVVDHIQIDTWAYQKTGLNTYRASNNGSLNIRVDWTASADGHEVNGACASTVRIEGPDTNMAKDSSNCGDSRFMEVRQPGNYRVTVTTTQDSGAKHEDGIDVTVLPG